MLAHTQAYRRQAILDDRKGLNRVFPAPRVRRLPAEVMFAALWQWAGHEQGDAFENREVLPIKHPLRLLGRGGRVWADSDSASVTHELARFLINGELVKAASEGRGVNGLRDRGPEEWSLAILGRSLSVDELRLIQSHLDFHPETGRSDVIWALINTCEFVFQR